MLKYLLLGFLIYFVFQLLFKKNKPQTKKDERISELMKCEQCGTYTAQSEMLSKNGKLYCGEKCLMP